MKQNEGLYHQRVQTIVSGYTLAGDEVAPFAIYLTALMERFPPVILELALVETLVRQWLRVPLQTGVAFLHITHALLQEWHSSGFNCSLTPIHFEMITGLDPAPVFDPLEKVLQGWGRSSARATATVAMPVTEMP